MKQEIAALEKETGANPETEELAKQLIDARAKLATLGDRFGQDHPDILQTKGTIRSLEQELRRIGSAAPSRSPIQRPENPAYINIQAQRNSVTSSLEALKASRTIVKRRVYDYAKRIERTPEIEPDYLALARDRDTSSQKYQDIRSRLLEATVSEGLEVQRKGERFSLIDPPGLPETPEKPNRKAIGLLGFILALAGGAGSAVVAEHLDRSIRTPEQLVRLTQTFPLAVIPYMPNKKDFTHAMRRRRMIQGASLGRRGVTPACESSVLDPAGCTVVCSAEKIRYRVATITRHLPYLICKRRRRRTKKKGLSWNGFKPPLIDINSNSPRIDRFPASTAPRPFGQLLRRSYTPAPGRSTFRKRYCVNGASWPGLREGSSSMRLRFFARKSLIECVRRVGT